MASSARSTVAAASDQPTGNPQRSEERNKFLEDIVTLQYICTKTDERKSVFSQQCEQNDGLACFINQQLCDTFGSQDLTALDDLDIWRYLRMHIEQLNVCFGYMTENIHGLFLRKPLWLEGVLKLKPEDPKEKQEVVSILGSLSARFMSALDEYLQELGIFGLQVKKIGLRDGNDLTLVWTEMSGNGNATSYSCRATERSTEAGTSIQTSLHSKFQESIRLIPKAEIALESTVHSMMMLTEGMVKVGKPCGEDAFSIATETTESAEVPPGPSRRSESTNWMGRGRFGREIAGS